MRYLGVLCLLTAVSASAQSEAALKASLEGKKATLKLDMPAGKEGLAVYPKAQPMVDRKRYALHLRQNGPSLRKGEPVTISAVHIDAKSIEVQLTGGRYGILSDDIRATPHSIDIPKESHTPPSRSLGIAQINLWYQDKSLKTTVPAPGEIERVLSEYLEFGRNYSGTQISTTLSATAAKLKKGMTEGEVVHLFGAPRRSQEHMEDGVKIVTNTFYSAQQTIDVDFVKNTVVNFRIR